MVLLAWTGGTPTRKVHLAYYDVAAKSWTLEPAVEQVGPVDEDKPALAFVARQWPVSSLPQWLLAYKKENGIRLMAQDGSVSDDASCPWTSPWPERPFLVAGPPGVLLLYETAGSPSVEPPPVWLKWDAAKARRLTVSKGVVSCKDPHYFYQLNNTKGLPFNLPKDPLNSVVVSQGPSGDGGPTAVVFPPNASARLQLFVPTELKYDGHYDGTVGLRQLSLGLPPYDPSDELYAAGSESRLTEVVESAAQGAAGIPLVWEDASGAYLFLYRRGGPGSTFDTTSIWYSYKRSN